MASKKFLKSLPRVVKKSLESSLGYREVKTIEMCDETVLSIWYAVYEIDVITDMNK